jgi:2-oxoglutarate ferredoxin oxidoreductase subunit alpha
VPDFLPIGGKRLVRQTSSTHGANGYITTDPEEIDMMQQRLKEKIVGAVADFTYFDETLVPEGDTLVVTYGVTARAAKVAIERLKEKGQPTSLLVLKTLWPVPEAFICEKAALYKRVVVAEMNLGQYVREIQRLVPGKEVAFMGEMNGELIKPGQIMEMAAHG